MRRSYDVYESDYDLLFDLPLHSDLEEKVKGQLPTIQRGIGSFDTEKGLYVSSGGLPCLEYDMSQYTFPSEYRDFYAEMTVNVTTLKYNVLVFCNFGYRACLLSSRNGSTQRVWNIPANRTMQLISTCHIDDSPYKETHHSEALISGNYKSDYSFTSRDYSAQIQIAQQGCAGWIKDIKLYGLKTTKR